MAGYEDILDKPRLEIAFDDIQAHFNEMDNKIFRRRQMESLLKEQRGFWRLPGHITIDRFIKFLISKEVLNKVTLKFPSRDETRYTWGEQSILAVALTLGKGAYLTHYTAMHLHALTDQIPKTIYVNVEQAPKRKPNSALEQHRIDAAFRRGARISKTQATYFHRKVCLLSGQSTGGLGVIRMDGSHGDALQVTNLERTLIDATVRPAYSGGVSEVLEAYKRASSKVSINKLTGYLRTLDYTYPYHQAIGFYLERSGAYSSEQIDLIREFPLEFDFYLAHGIQETDYSKQWRLYFPKGL